MQWVKKVLIVLSLSAVVLPLTARECASGLGFHFNLWGPCGSCGLGFDLCLCPPCFQCHQPPAFCGCAPAVAPQPVYQPTPVGTTYVPQQYVTYRDVPHTAIRREAYVEHVPVTAYEQVTKTVYVPQQVTETVPRTVYQPQTRYRDVAYQTYQRVAETHTRLVPRQTVSIAQPVTHLAADCCGPSYAPSATTSLVVPSAPYPAVAPPVYPPAPLSAAPPQTSPGVYGTTPSVPRYPDAPSASSEWSTIQPRATSRAGSPTPARRSSMFRPAPSAATVQQSPRF